MKNPRELEFWNNGFFGAWHHTKGDPGDRLFMAFLGVLVGVFIGLFTLGFAFEGILSGFDDPEGWGLFLGAVIGGIFGPLMIMLGPVYKGHGVPHTYNDYNSLYYYEDTPRKSLSHDLPQRVKEYFSLSKEDRRLYPRGIIDILKDPDLTAEQRADLDTKMRGVYAGIRERDKERRLLAKRDVDVSALLEYMDDAKSGLEIQAKTYREYR